MIDQRGDTIVEVLIAIAVVSSVLGMTYAIMNSNVSKSLDNQERTGASKLLQEQVELLSGYSSVVKDKNNGETFCLYYDEDTDEVLSAPVGINGGGDNNDPAELKEYDSFHEGFSTRCITESKFYTRVEVLEKNQSFRATTLWDRLDGGRSRAILSYRIR